MPRTLLMSIMLLTFSIVNGQTYKKYQSKTKHAKEIKSIATSDSLFATSSADMSVIVWDYSGKLMYKYKLDDGKINSMAFIPNSHSLLVAVTEMIDGKIIRQVIKCLSRTGDLEYELIDKTLTQENVDALYEQNVTGVRNAIADTKATFPGLNVKDNVRAPRAKNGMSHIELVQSIAVSPDNKTIASIDKFNVLKTWDQHQNVLSTFQITNSKKDTNIYFRSDSTLFIEPNIILNIRDTSAQIIKRFEKYSAIPFSSVVYFHFNYNDYSRPERLYNLATSSTKEFDLKNFYTASGAASRNSVALLGIDGLIRVLNKDGELLSTFGKDKNETVTFRGETIQKFSNISAIGISPDGRYVVSGYENGKVIIWKWE